jgi:23S rRNA (cytosine1962-C5)-methyltransferase
MGENPGSLQGIPNPGRERPRPSWILHADDQIVVVDKPAGINTHRASDESPDGMVEILHHYFKERGPPAVHQRLDRETSGVMVFGRGSDVANKSFAEQFSRHQILKQYRFITRSNLKLQPFVVRTPIDGKEAETSFIPESKIESGTLWNAIPKTGRTHQIRIHAAEKGIPILGDRSRGGGEGPLLLHAAELGFTHPATGESVRFSSPLPEYFKLPDPIQRSLAVAIRMRSRLISTPETNAFRVVHHSADGFPRHTVDYLNGWFYIEDFSPGESDDDTPAIMSRYFSSQTELPYRGCILSRAIQGERRSQKEILHSQTTVSAESVIVEEAGVKFLLKPMQEGSYGVFFDQRENRHTTLQLMKAKPGSVLNLFSYTCGFSAAAALGGARRTVSVDLSRNVLEWGKENFRLNGLDPDSNHEFMMEDAGAAMKWLQKRGEKFDVVVLDPPSFSRSKKGKTFSVRKDLSSLVAQALGMLNSSGWLLVSTNLADWKRTAFEKEISLALYVAGRSAKLQKMSPQPPDFPATTECPGYLKAMWIQVGDK